MSPVFNTTVRPETDLSMPVSMTSYHLGNVIVGDVAAPAQNLERSARLAGLQGIDHILIQFYRSGASYVETVHRRSEVKAQHFIIYDLAQPVLVVSPSSVSVTYILLPRALLGDHVAKLDALHGAVSSYETDPVARLFFTYLQGVVACGDALARHHLSGIAQAASKLLSAVIAGSDAATPAEVPQRVSVEIRRFIDGALSSPDLCAETICDRFGMSRATLYRHFAAEDGVQNYIRERRLLRAMRMLTRGDGGPRPRVSAVAYATGFSDEKTFSRAFKRRFGILPREAAADDQVARVTSRQDDLSLLTWMRQLAA